MDLSKMSNDKKLHICKWYFRGGFAALPFLWAVNSIWFFKEAFCMPQYDEQKQIRKYVILSGIGAILWAIILLSWIVTFQTQRAAWGEFGDAISFIIPQGIP
ncbi:hypothetical protein PV327_004283 [Microctonus hyperodae]|uniref:Gamma-secretase subunit PEN-2 n=1 Tax=Microctonus hyperodae TaxID=165561 RepID=A0AA39FC38_MICHY|nr:hypothetical protein PV327_004283 [Microctonus hyperodae]